MADQGGASNESPRVSKHWVKLFPDGVSRAEKKRNRRILDWDGSSTKPLIPSGIGSGAKKRNAEEVIDNYLARKRIKLTSPHALKIKKTLPFSGSDISVHYNQGEVKLTAKKITFPHKSVLDTFSDIITSIETLREEKQQLASELTYHQAEFFCHATQFVSIFAEQFGIIKTSGTIGNPDSLEIDRDFLRLAMSLETLHPHYVAQEMYSFVENLTHMVYKLKSIFHSLGDIDVNRTKSLDQLVDGTLALRNALVHAKNTPLSLNNMTSNPGELETPAVTLREFIEVIRNNNFGRSICSMLPIAPRILEQKFNFKDGKITRGGEEYRMIEDWTYDFYKRGFYLLRQGSSSTESVHEEEFHPSFPVNSLKGLLDERGYTIPRYAGIERRAQHLMSTVTKSDHKDSITKILDISTRCREVFSSKGHEAMPAWYSA